MDGAQGAPPDEATKMTEQEMLDQELHQRMQRCGSRYDMPESEQVWAGEGSMTPASVDAEIRTWLGRVEIQGVRDRLHELMVVRLGFERTEAARMRRQRDELLATIPMLLNCSYEARKEIIDRAIAMIGGES